MSFGPGVAGDASLRTREAEPGFEEGRFDSRSEAIDKGCQSCPAAVSLRARCVSQSPCPEATVERRAQQQQDLCMPALSPSDNIDQDFCPAEARPKIGAAFDDKITSLQLLHAEGGWRMKCPALLGSLPNAKSPWIHHHSGADAPSHPMQCRCTSHLGKLEQRHEDDARRCVEHPCNTCVGDAIEGPKVGFADLTVSRD